jgi:hypothetical protein
MVMMFTKRGQSAAKVATQIDEAFATRRQNWVEPLDGRYLTTNGAPVANTGYWWWFRVDEAITVTTASIDVQATATGNVVVGIYSSDGTTFTRLAVSAATAIGPSTTIQTIALGSSVTLSPGVDYYAYFAADTASATFIRAAVASGRTASHNVKSRSKTSEYPSSASVAISATATNGVCNWISFNP